MSQADATPPAIRRMAWGNRALDFGARIYVMGIVNATPDSFYAASRGPDRNAALDAAERMIAAGADVIDVGGESTRPGAEAVPEEEEARRVVPLIRELRRRSGVMISVDTRRRSVAEQAVAAGADLVNTVGGLEGDDDFAAFIARARVPVVLMHMRGTPRTMQQNPHYDDAPAEVRSELAALAAHAAACGIPEDMIIVDPGIGFGKRPEDNLALVKHLDKIRELGRPVLIGVSRKSFLGAATGRPVEERLAGTIAANALAAYSGADILRVHDVPEAVDTARLVEALRAIT